ncbi:MAG: hypothetical protein AAB624_00290 [Patescibacteria group bacterium]
MKQQLIAIDIDDVIAASTESVRLLANERTGSNLTEDHYKTAGEYWGYYERVWREHDLEDKLSYQDLSAEMAIDQLHVPLLAGAEIGVATLLEKHKTVLITSRDPGWELATIKWTKHHFGERIPELYFSRNHKDTKEKTKGELCIELGATWLIDDNVEHCLSAIKVGVGAVLFGEYGWQQNKSKELIHCKDWSAVIEFFDGKAV